MSFTPDSQLELLFDASLISPEPVAALADKGLHIRPLSSTDYARGFLKPLEDLTSTPDIGEQSFIKRFIEMQSLPSTYYLLVIVDKHTDQILATGALFVELKFIRGAARVGHIEDIAVRKDAQGKKLGLHLIKALTSISENVGCYKCILDCSEDARGFYEKCSYEYKGVQMGKYVK